MGPLRFETLLVLGPSPNDFVVCDDYRRCSMFGNVFSISYIYICFSVFYLEILSIGTRVDGTIYFGMDFLPVLIGIFWYGFFACFDWYILIWIFCLF